LGNKGKRRGKEEEEKRERGGKDLVKL